jgi:asparaginyl-tRNA synthetase
MSVKKGLTKVSEIYASPASFGGKRITVGGWIRNSRFSNAFGFIELNDGTYFKPVQVVAEDTGLNNYKDIAKQNIGASLLVTGTLVLTPEAKQPLEIKAEEIEVTGTSTPDYPLQPKKHSAEYLRSIDHLRPRSNMFNAVFRVRSAAAQGIHEFFAKNGFVYVNTPIVTCSDCEGAGEMFRITTLDMENPPKTEEGKIDYSKDFFSKPANLTVSGQLEAECFALAFSNVYTFGPTFRAENSNTPRHAAEF